MIWVVSLFSSIDSRNVVYTQNVNGTFFNEAGVPVAIKTKFRGTFNGETKWISFYIGSVGRKEFCIDEMPLHSVVSEKIKCDNNHIGVEVEGVEDNCYYIPKFEKIAIKDEHGNTTEALKLIGLMEIKPDLVGMYDTKKCLFEFSVQQKFSVSQHNTNDCKLKTQLSKRNLKLVKVGEKIDKLLKTSHHFVTEMTGTIAQLKNGSSQTYFDADLTTELHDFSEVETPFPIWGYILIGCGAAIVLISIIVVICILKCRKSDRYSTARSPSLYDNFRNMIYG